MSSAIAILLNMRFLKHRLPNWSSYVDLAQVSTGTINTLVVSGGLLPRDKPGKLSSNAGAESPGLGTGS